MSSLIELLTEIANSLVPVGEYAQVRRFERAVDLEPFIAGMEETIRRAGGQRCGEDRLCLDDGVLIYEVQPLLSPDRRGLAEDVRRQLGDVEGLTVTRIERPYEHVLGMAASTAGGWVEVRIVAHRGWVFLVGADDEASAGRLTSILDHAVDALESPSGSDASGT